ncbi:CueP family metal-binding protein [Tessaracoccus oleiagri]|uniref:Lipoprotein n=1 Tax=Tessaracoccus oleiagri TaxID=686624 RepID=A0A1G9LZH0_9ACTN|nr:CueP family metal-binding protein [Tessaracoccus oleiagri]SDL66805.1 hypothetical protein SAMN04488242_2398 [Tessaracoccus oleiagri]
MKLPKKPVLLTAAAVLALLTVTGCSPDAPADGATAAQEVDVLAKLGLDGVTGRALVDELEATPLEDRRDEFIASVRADHVVVTDLETERETTVPLPEDEFYLSIAPYVSRTHPCGFHSLTTCVGELRSAELDVTIVDDAGATVFEGAVTTQDNGFAGLWLPRDITGRITVEYDGRSATGPVSTGADAETCETDLELA